MPYPEPLKAVRLSSAERAWLLRWEVAEGHVVRQEDAVLSRGFKDQAGSVQRVLGRGLGPAI